MTAPFYDSGLVVWSPLYGRRSFLRHKRSFCSTHREWGAVVRTQHPSQSSSTSLAFIGSVSLDPRYPRRCKGAHACSAIYSGPVGAAVPAVVGVYHRLTDYLRSRSDLSGEFFLRWYIVKSSFVSKRIAVFV